MTWACIDLIFFWWISRTTNWLFESRALRRSGRISRKHDIIKDTALTRRSGTFTAVVIIVLHLLRRTFDQTLLHTQMFCVRSTTTTTYLSTTIYLDRLFSLNGTTMSLPRNHSNYKQRRHWNEKLSLERNGFYLEHQQFYNVHHARDSSRTWESAPFGVSREVLLGRKLAVIKTSSVGIYSEDKEHGGGTNS